MAFLCFSMMAVTDSFLMPNSLEADVPSSNAFLANSCCQAQLVAVFGKGTQYRCLPLAVQLQRVEGGCYLPHTRSALSHTFEDT